MLNVVDDSSRALVLQVDDYSISGQWLAREPGRLAARRPLPKATVCDNGPEFTRKAMFFRSKQAVVKLLFSQSGKPTQNAFDESSTASSVTTA